MEGAHAIVGQILSVRLGLLSALLISIAVHPEPFPAEEPPVSKSVTNSIDVVSSSSKTAIASKTYQTMDNGIFVRFIREGKQLGSLCTFQLRLQGATTIQSPTHYSGVIVKALQNQAGYLLNNHQHHLQVYEGELLEIIRACKGNTYIVRKHSNGHSYDGQLDIKLVFAPSDATAERLAKLCSKDFSFSGQDHVALSAGSQLAPTSTFNTSPKLQVASPMTAGHSDQAIGLPPQGYSTIERLMEKQAYPLGKRHEMFAALTKYRKLARKRCTCSSSFRHWLADRNTWQEVFSGTPFPAESHKPSGQHDDTCLFTRPQVQAPSMSQKSVGAAFKSTEVTTFHPTRIDALVGKVNSNIPKPEPLQIGVNGRLVTYHSISEQTIRKLVGLGTPPMDRLFYDLDCRIQMTENTSFKVFSAIPDHERRAVSFLEAWIKTVDQSKTPPMLADFWTEYHPRILKEIGPKLAEVCVICKGLPTEILYCPSQNVRSIEESWTTDTQDRTILGKTTGRLFFMSLERFPHLLLMKLDVEPDPRSPGLRKRLDHEIMIAWVKSFISNSNSRISPCLKLSIFWNSYHEAYIQGIIEIKSEATDIDEYQCPTSLVASIYHVFSSTSQTGLQIFEEKTKQRLKVSLVNQHHLKIDVVSLDWNLSELSSPSDTSAPRDPRKLLVLALLQHWMAMPVDAATGFRDVVQDFEKNVLIPAEEEPDNDNAKFRSMYTGDCDASTRNTAGVVAAASPAISFQSGSEPPLRTHDTEEDCWRKHAEAFNVGNVERLVIQEAATVSAPFSIDTHVYLFSQTEGNLRMVLDQQTNQIVALDEYTQRTRCRFLTESAKFLEGEDELPGLGNVMKSNEDVLSRDFEESSHEEIDTEMEIDKVLNRYVQIEEQGAVNRAVFEDGDAEQMMILTVENIEAVPTTEAKPTQQDDSQHCSVDASSGIPESAIAVECTASQVAETGQKRKADGEGDGDEREGKKVCL